MLGPNPANRPDPTGDLCKGIFARAKGIFSLPMRISRGQRNFRIEYVWKTLFVFCHLAYVYVEEIPKVNILIYIIYINILKC